MAPDLSTYGTFQLRQSIADNPHAVRDEAARRHEQLQKRIRTARANLLNLEASAAELEDLHGSAIRYLGQ